MLERTRVEGVFFLGLLIGSTMGGVGALAAWSRSPAELLSNFSLVAVLGMSGTGVVFGLWPYLAIAVPTCLVLERHISSAKIRTAVLAAGGASTGAVISALTMDFLIAWAAMVGGFAGLALGFLRRRAGQLNWFELRCFRAANTASKPCVRPLLVGSGRKF